MENIEGGKKASTRVVMHGFKVDTDAPTHIRLLQYLATKHWKVFVAEFKSAFLQTPLLIFGVPSGDVREKIERMMGLGDVRAARIRNHTAHHSMKGTHLHSAPDGTLLASHQTQGDVT